MIKFDSRQVNIFLLRYRKIFVALIISFLVWSLTLNPPTGATVLIAKEFIPQNSSLSRTQFAQIQVSNFDTSEYLADFSELKSTFAGQDIQAGSLMVDNYLKSEVGSTTRVDVFISVENSGIVRPGAKLHLWTSGDEYKRLVSSDAVVRSSHIDNYQTHLRVSIPILDEYEVMQSNEIKIAIIN